MCLNQILLGKPIRHHSKATTRRNRVPVYGHTKSAAIAKPTRTCPAAETPALTALKSKNPRTNII